MKDIIESLANNNYVIIGLSVLLGILIILFFVLLFSKNKKKPEESKPIDEENISGSTTNNIDFDHSEYVKETTVEFELTPITDVQPTPDGFVPEVKVEESPAIDKNAKSIDDVPLADFNFDELSKSISQEIENLKKEEEAAAINESNQATVDAFKEVEDIKPVEVTKVDSISASNISQPTETSNPTPAPVTQEFNEFIIDAPTPVTTEAPINNPEPVQTTTASEVQTQAQNGQQTPIFASFNQETFDINKKD